MTWSYTTSMLFSDRIASTAEAGATASDCATAVTCSPFPASPHAGRGDMPARLLRLRRLIAGLGALRPRLVLGHIVLGGGIEQRLHLVLHGRDPIGDLDPIGAVPLLHVSRMVAVVVRATHFDWAGEALEPEFFPARRRDLQAFEAATDVVGVDHLLASQLLGVADCLGNDRRVQNPAVIEVLADLVLRRLALALVDDVFHDVLNGRIVGPDAVEVQRQVAFAAGRSRTRVILAARPPDADEMIHRVVDLGGF